jgi:hypothetical protein
MVREAGEREKIKVILYVCTRIVYTSLIRNLKTGARVLEWMPKKY